MSAGWHKDEFLGPRARPTTGTYNRLPRRFNHREPIFLHSYKFKVVNNWLALFAAAALSDKC